MRYIKRSCFKYLCKHNFKFQVKGTEFAFFSIKYVGILYTFVLS